MPKYFLEILVFLCGAIVMILELVGSRIMAPFAGTSLIVWTTIIGVVLGNLSIGYYLGGRLADKSANKSVLSGALFLAGCCILIILLVQTPLLTLLSTLKLSLIEKAILATVLLFSAPNIFLGMITPLAVRLKMKALKTSGSTVGNFSALSTIGSISGTFFAGFYLISHFTLQQIILGMSIVLFLLSSLLFFQMKKFFIFTLLFLSSLLLQRYSQAPHTITINSPYNYIRVITTSYNNSPARLLMLDNTFHSMMYLGKNDLVFDYSKIYRLAGHFAHPLRNVLVIGGGGYSVPKDFMRLYPSMNIDVVEIDPAVTAVAKKYFNLKDDKRLQIFSEDGRVFLNRMNEKKKQTYDAILIDAFNSSSIPFHLTTEEVIQTTYSLLQDEGIVMVNLISSISGEKSKFLQAEYKTYRSIFPYVYVIQVTPAIDPTEAQNLMLVAVKSTTRPRLRSDHPEFDQYLTSIWKGRVADTTPFLTDNFAPVDQYISEIKH